MLKLDKMKSRHNSRQFTLVELLVVIGVMGLLMTMAMPQFSKMIAGNKLNEAVNKVGAMMSHARSYAISKRREVSVTIDVSKKTYKSVINEKIWNSGNGEWDDNPQPLDPEKKLPTGTTFSATTTVTFRPSGQLSGVNADVTFNIKDTKNGTTMDITIDKYTGKVSYAESTP